MFEVGSPALSADPPALSTWQMQKSQTVEIRPPQPWTALNLKELWGSRELLVFLVWRDFRLRYTQTVVGLVWAIVKPLSVVAIFNLVFGWLVQLPSDGLPYPIFAYCALLPWQLFSYTLVGISACLVANQNLLTKVYFPRLVLPLSVLVMGWLDFLIALTVLIGMVLYYRVPLTGNLWVALLFVLLASMTAMGVGLWLSVLNVRYRDVGHMLPFLLQGWLFVTPVIYPSSLVPDSWRIVMGLNPLVSVVDGMRWAILGSVSPPVSMVALSVGVAALLFLSGVYWFRRTEQTFADEV